MVTSCCVLGCSNEHKKGCHINFFSFPFKNPELLNKWIAAIKRKNWVPKAHSRICSVHFTKSDYQIRPGAKYPLLKITAIPSISPAFSTYYKVPSNQARASQTQSSVDHELKEQASEGDSDSTGPSESELRKKGRKQLINELEQQTSEDPVTFDSEGPSEPKLKKGGEKKLINELEHQTSEDSLTSDSAGPSEPKLKKRENKQLINELEQQTSADSVISDSTGRAEPKLKKRGRKKLSYNERVKSLTKINECLTQKVGKQRKKIKILKTLIASLKEKGLSDLNMELLLLDV
ncbi:peroxynitrite isomerase THAP4-like [Harmonia axyridis]|uniref:peroxynitrite isomerase THAP4-like n=1 Tax=Harmonia axyridis TaxID=115357 RepID=UPI001E278725|nr:peroxynitrite isomerase THAP4-like [Harmonia axyridis]